MYSYYKEVCKKDSRQKRWKKQRKAIGFDDTEIWNLDLTICKFLIDRLQLLHDVDDRDDKLFYKDLRNMIKYLKEYVKADCFPTTKMNRKFFKLFKKNFERLWY